MKKARIIFMIVFLLSVVSLGSAAAGTKAEAAGKLTNVMKAPKAKKGNWVIQAKGYRYRYTSTKKYAKNEWLNIDSYIYYFKSDGYLQIGWKTYNGNKYYFDYMGCLTTGWQKIGKYYYYFSTSNGRMAVNKKIGKYYVDKKGRRSTVVSAGEKEDEKNDSGQTAIKTGNAAVKKTGSVDIFVGDSRTVGMGEATGTSSKCIAKVGEGYTWFVNTAIPQLKKKLKKNPKATVVIGLGINDIANYEAYIKKYRSLMKSYPKARFYFMSVNPVDSKYDWGWLSYSSMSKWIKKFNKALKKAFPDNYIDCYTYLKKNKFATVDGVHYKTATYKKIYKYILNQV